MSDIIRRLERVFNPRTVAVVGDKRAMGYFWLRNMSTFTGKLYSVQIDPNEIPGILELGVSNYASLLDIPDEIDYVVCAVPRPIAPRIVADCVAKKVGGVSLFTSGFAETGEAEGIRLQEQIASMARDGGLVLIGPNCMGIYNRRLGVRQAMDQPAGDEGDVGFISHSGTHAINFSLLGAAARRQGQQVGERGQLRRRHSGRLSGVHGAGRRRRRSSACTWRACRTAGASSKCCGRRRG